MHPDRKCLPSLHMVSFANGVGKTKMCVLDMIGWMQGPDYLNRSVYPEECLEYWNSLSKMRDEGLLSLRLVCDAVDMKADGSLLMTLKDTFPIAVAKHADNSGCFRAIECWHPTKEVKNSIAVKTFEQAVIAHAGSTCQRIWANERLPLNLVSETFGRIRSKKGAPQGSVAMYATLLDEADWVDDLKDDKDLYVVNSKGHLYENCVGEEVTDDMAYEVFEKIGVELEKTDVGYLTNGVLTQESINTLVRMWMRTRPDEVEARKCGSPIRGVGRIIVKYSPLVHRIKDSNLERIPDGAKIIHIVDPHSARPSFSAWAVVKPMDQVVFFEEWPPVEGYGFYDKITERRHQIKEECQIWDEIEKQWGIKNKIAIRIGDPNRMKDPIIDQNKTIADVFKDCGYNFMVDVNDDLAYGHQVLNEYFFYDAKRMENNPLDLSAIPRAYILERCENLSRGAGHYAFKKNRRPEAPITEKVSQIFKDTVDVIRYALVWHKDNPYNSMNSLASDNSSDYNLIKEGRVPSRFRAKSKESENGRRILDW